MRGMALRPVNPQKATSMVGHGPDLDDEFVVTRLARDGRTEIDSRKDDDQSMGTYSIMGGGNHVGNRRRLDEQTDDRRGDQIRNVKGNRRASDESGNREGSQRS